MSDETRNDMTSSEPEEAGARTAVAAPPVPPAPPAPPATAAAPWPWARNVERGWRAGGIFFGVLLVIVGGFALFGGVGSLVDVFRLWPVLIVLGGVAHMFDAKREVLVKRVAEGLGSVAVGLVFLGITIGPLRWTIWFSFLSLWPLLVIALGIELVGRGLRLGWLRALSNVLLIAGLAYAVFVMAPVPGRSILPFTISSAASTAYSDVEARATGVATGRAVVKVGATQLSLTAGDDLAGIEGRAPKDEAPTLEASTEGGNAAITVSDPLNRSVFIATADRSLALKLDRAVKWSEVRLDMGAVAADLDMRELQVQKVVLNVGASDAILVVGSLESSVTVEVSGGVASLTIRVPAAAACRVDSTSGLSDVRVPGSFTRTSGIGVIGSSTYVSAGSGGPTIHVSLASGVSDLRIESY